MLDIDSRVAALAAEQFRVVTRAQLLQLGMTPRMIEIRLKKGLLTRVYKGVYSLGGMPQEWIAKLFAAHRYLGDASAVSHRSAARYWGLDGFESQLVELTVSGKRAAPAGVSLHCSRSLDATDVRRMAMFQVTKVERTLLDLGGVVGASRVEEAFESAMYQRLTTLDRIQDRFDALRPHRLPGSATLGDLLAQRDPKLAPTESIFETRFYRMLTRSRRIPPAARQYVLRDAAGFVARLDLAWPSAQVGIECYSKRWHSQLKKCMFDSRRHNRITGLGWVVLYAMYEDLNDEAASIMSQLEDLLIPRLDSTFPR